MNNSLRNALISSATELIQSSDISEPIDSTDVAIRATICGVEAIGFGASLVGFALNRLNPIVPAIVGIGSIVVDCIAFKNTSSQNNEDSIESNIGISYDGTPLGPITEENYERYGDKNV